MALFSKPYASANSRTARPLLSRAQAEHQFLPHRFRQRFAAVKHLVPAHPDFLVVGGADSRAVDPHLLAHHHAVRGADLTQFAPLTGCTSRGSYYSPRLPNLPPCPS